MALTRRSFLAGLITAPAIVHAANIMKVRPFGDEILPLPGFGQQWVNPDEFSIELLKEVVKVMREGYIPAFERSGERYLFLTSSQISRLPIGNIQVVPILQLPGF